MPRLRLGLRIGPFVVTSSPRRRPGVPSMPLVTLRALALAAVPIIALNALAWWWMR